MAMLVALIFPPMLMLLPVSDRLLVAATCGAFPAIAPPETMAALVEPLKFSVPARVVVVPTLSWAVALLKFIVPTIVAEPV
jgi:hypothetical protein